MKTQTAKQFVLERYPDAEMLRTLLTRSYYVRFGFHVCTSARTKYQAWQNAETKIEEMEKGK